MGTPCVYGGLDLHVCVILLVGFNKPGKETVIQVYYNSSDKKTRGNNV